MKQTFLAVSCILLAVLYFNSLEAMAAATTVRPYKFGFTIEEQQHRSEKRDENGIVMGEFGFITADGKYHVTVYATDENGKFKIISMKSFPYAGPVAPSTPTAIATTTRAPLSKHQFSSPACSGCFLSKSPAVAAPVQGTVAAPAPRPHKTEIRPLSLPLPPAPVAAPAGATEPAAGANPASNNGLAQTPTSAQSLPANGNFGKPSLSNSPNSAAATTKPGSGQASLLNSPNSAPTATKPGQASLFNSPALAATATKTGTGQHSLSNSATLATTSTNQLAGDLYKFKYLLDYNGHEETGSRNGDKEGNYFAIGEDEVSRTIEYIANEFGFQPHISWRKLDQSEVASLPKENSLKHYEFKWFNKASE